MEKKERMKWEDDRNFLSMRWIGERIWTICKVYIEPRFTYKSKRIYFLLQYSNYSEILYCNTQHGTANTWSVTRILQKKSIRNSLITRKLDCNTRDNLVKKPSTWLTVSSLENRHVGWRFSFQLFPKETVIQHDGFS